MAEFKENAEAAIQRDISIRFESMLTSIRDEGKRQRLSEQEIEKLCLAFIDNFARGEIDFDPKVPHVNGNIDHNSQKDFPKGDKKNNAEKIDRKRVVENQAQLDRYRKEISTFIGEIFGTYRCPMAQAIPDTAPVRIPGHPGGTSLQQQFWEREYISQVDKCPVTRKTLPRDWWGVDRHVNAEAELFLFLVAADAWLKNVPIELMEEKTDIGRQLRSARTEIAEILAKPEHSDRIKTAKDNLAALKAGKVINQFQRDRALLNFLVRNNEEDRKINEDEDKNRQEQSQINAKAEEERKSKAAAAMEETLLRNQMEQFQNMVTTFQCPIETAFPKHPVRIKNHPQVQQRRQLYLQTHAITLAICPITRQNLNVAAAEALQSARPILCLFAVATETWMRTLPRPLLDELNGTQEEIADVLNEALNAVEILRAREIFENIRAGRAVDPADLSKDDEELLGFLVHSRAAELKAKAEAQRREIDRQFEAAALRQAASRQAAEAMRRRIANEADARRRARQAELDAEYGADALDFLVPALAPVADPAPAADPDLDIGQAIWGVMNWRNILGAVAAGPGPGGMGQGPGLVGMGRGAGAAGPGEAGPPGIGIAVAGHAGPGPGGAGIPAIGPGAGPGPGAAGPGPGVVPAVPAAVGAAVPVVAVPAPVVKTPGRNCAYLRGR